MPRILTTACALIVLLAASAGATTPTSVDQLAVSAGATSVAVSGAATFRDVPVETGTDGSGDASMPGTDVTKATISMPTSGKVRFRLELAGALPQLSSSPTAVFLWPLTVDGQNTGLTLHGSRARVGVLPTDPHLRLVRISGGSITTVATVAGTMANGVVEWDVPLANLAANPGSQIISESAITVVPGISGVGTVNGSNFDDMTAETPYVVPSRTVLVGVGAAGSSIEPATAATVAANGSFTATLPRPAEPGGYEVVARACYGPQSCGSAKASFTI